MFCIKDKEEKLVIYHNDYIMTLLQKKSDINELSEILNTSVDEVKKIILTINLINKSHKNTK